jgi:hypothetical protein
MYVASALLGLGAVAARSKYPAAGERLLGAAEGLIASLAAPQFPRDQPVLQRGLTALQSTLDQDQVTALRKIGQSMPLAQEVAEAEETTRAIVQEKPDQQG